MATLARTWAGPAKAVRASRPGRGLAGVAVGLGLGLLALGPGLRRGFLLSYDMLFVPREPFSAAWPGQAPPRAVPSDLVIAALSRAVPADIAQKAILLSVFVLACSGAAALLDREPVAARLAAGVFYAWNPYVGERLIIGQWALLLGYAGLPWVLRAVLAPGLASRRGAARLGLALAPAVIGGFAAMAITALVVVPAALLGRSARRAAVALGALAAGSLPWLIPAVLRPVYVDPASVAAFAARADTPFGSMGSLLMLGGSWNAQTVPEAYGGAWSALWLAVVIIALGGYLLRARPGRRWPGLGVAAAAGLVIAGLGVTAAGRDLLRAMIGAWPGFAACCATPSSSWRRWRWPRPRGSAWWWPGRWSQDRSAGKGTVRFAGMRPEPCSGWSRSSRRCCCCPAWPGGPPGGCGRPPTRPAGWPRRAWWTAARRPAACCCCRGKRTGRSAGTTARRCSTRGPGYCHVRWSGTTGHGSGTSSSSPMTRWRGALTPPSAAAAR